MKTFLAVIGSIGLLIFGVVIAGIILLVVKNGPALKEAKSYSNDAIPTVTTSWDGNALLNRSAPELIEVLKGGELETFMADGERTMGGLTSKIDSECTNFHMVANTNDGKYSTVTCTARATHQRSEAEYSLSLIKRQGEWKILKFHVNPIESEHKGTDI